MDDEAAGTETARLLEGLALVVGFGAFAGGVFLAHRSPVPGSEASLFTATPTGTWVGLGISLLLALVVAFFGRENRYRRYALLLGGGFLFAVASLPLVRNYYFFGHSDSLTHLGWARDIAAGELGVTDLFYPAVHASAVVFSDLLGVGIARAMLLVVFFVGVVFLLFVPLAVRALTDDTGLVIGVFAALLVLPVNHIALHYINPHPISEAVLLSPLVLYLLVRYLNGDVGPSRFGVSAVGGVLALSLLTTLIFHTMQAANLIAVFGLIAVFQWVVRRYGATPLATAGNRTVYAHLGFLLVVFALWNVQFSVVITTVQMTVDAILGFFSGTSSAGAVVSSRSSSLSGLGTGLGELFLKLFVPSAIFSLLTAGLWLYSLRHWGDRSLSDVRVLGVGLVGLGLITIPFVAGTTSRLVFRNMGFVMSFGTILGAAALVKLLGNRGGLFERSIPTRAVVVVVFALMIASSTLILFPSPYMYHPNSGVAETEYNGYERAFEVRDTEVRFAGIRNGPQRNVQAIYGRNDVPADLDRFGYYRLYGGIDGQNLTRLPEYVTRQRYLVVTRHDKLREIEAYQRLRYNESQFAAIPDQYGVDRVMSNGQFELYLIRPAGES